MNGAGSCGPGPGGAVGPGGSPGANVDGGGGRTGRLQPFAAGPGWRVGRQRHRCTRHVGRRNPGTSGVRNPRRRRQAIRLRRRREHIGQRRIGPVRPEGTLPLIHARARHRVAGPREEFWRRDIGARRARRHRGSRVIRGALQYRGCRRGCTVGEPGAVGVREAEGRQPGAAPEVLRVNPALLERGVHPRLQDPVRQQVADHHLEVGSGADRLAQRRGVSAQRIQHGGKVFLMRDQHDP